jgi:hypothetical protein
MDHPQKQFLAVVLTGRVLHECPVAMQPYTEELLRSVGLVMASPSRKGAGGAVAAAQAQPAPAAGGGSGSTMALLAKAGLVSLGKQKSIVDAWTKYETPDTGYRASETLFLAERERITASLNPGATNKLAWRKGLDREWSEWKGFTAYVTGLTRWFNEAPRHTPWTTAKTAEMLERWRKDDAEAAGVSIETLSVTSYVNRPGLAPFLKQRPVDPNGSNDPKEASGKWATPEWDQVRERRRDAVRSLRDDPMA